MSRLRLVVLLFLSAATVRAQEVSTVVVPVVGSTYGTTMMRWLTDVEIVNETAFPADVALELSTAPGAPVYVTTLGPGQGQRFTDIVGQAFGLESGLSPLRITSSGRGVTVRARAYAVRDTGVSPPQTLFVYGNDTWKYSRVLDGLAFSESQRTNIGLVNFGETEAYFLLALQRIPGRNLAVSTVRVSAGALVHASIQSLFPLISEGGGFSVVVETPFRETHVYASVIENVDDAATFIVPR